MQQLKIVVRYRDGRVLTGTTQNFNPLSGGFHLLPIPPTEDGKPVPIRLAELKAIFIVQDFKGNPEYVDDNTFADVNPSRGTRLRITFSDGEVLVGYSLNYDCDGPGFFLFPADPESNNQRVFVINGSVKEVTLVA